MTGFFRSMAGRVFLLLFAGIIVSAVLAFHFSGVQMQEQMQHQRVVRTTSIVEQLAVALDGADDRTRTQILRSAQAIGVRPVTPAMLSNSRPDSDLSVPVRQAFRSTRVRLAGDIQTGCRSGSNRCSVVSLVLHDGTPVVFAVDWPFGALHAELLNVAPVFLVFFLLCILALAYFVARFSTRPLGELARAARNLGEDIGSTPLPERGPSEVRAAATAFNAMQRRIQRDVRERTYMLAAITHDLQTPLTRLRLRLEQIQDEPLRTKLLEDLGSIRETAREGLELARSLESSESKQRIDLDALLDSICSDAQEAGHDVALTGTTGAAVLGAPNALRRCITNLLDNATTYGKYARVAPLTAHLRWYAFTTAVREFRKSSCNRSSIRFTGLRAHVRARRAEPASA